MLVWVAMFFLVIYILLYIPIMNSKYVLNAKRLINVIVRLLVVLVICILEIVCLVDFMEANKQIGLIVFLLIFTLFLAVEPIVYLSWCFYNKKISKKEELISKLKKQMENDDIVV